MIAQVSSFAHVLRDLLNSCDKKKPKKKACQLRPVLPSSSSLRKDSALDCSRRSCIKEDWYNFPPEHTASLPSYMAERNEAACGTAAPAESDSAGAVPHGRLAKVTSSCDLRLPHRLGFNRAPRLCCDRCLSKGIKCHTCL
jgi:hypothetical protein